MAVTHAHIINHTHWDREWFLTSIYTSQWIPGMVDVLDGIVFSNPSYSYFLDGQTLVIEDLLEVSPGHETIINRLCTNQNLQIGPYYCQPDWQLTAGEALLRNLSYGRKDMDRFGSRVRVGWLVDTFGHISQSPQIHRLFGLQAVYVWRGVPKMQPFFDWQGADGSTLFTINLFGGYRNLYGVTYTPEIAVQRLQFEVQKLSPYYPTGDIPLFDGYDLEVNPEDPVSFYEQRRNTIPRKIRFQASNPQDFMQQALRKLDDPPIIQGELNSGKYGATFPGTLSSRTYLKIMSRDCENLLYQVCEPLAVLASLAGRPYPASQYEKWGRLLLQNAVHDCICGVSIDQVHEKMEINYRRVFDMLNLEIRELANSILGGFAPGLYALSTLPCRYQGWQMIDDRIYPVETGGMGVWPLGAGSPVERPNSPVEELHWHNEHYHASIGADGLVRAGQALLGRLVVRQEKGDAYTEEAGESIGVCQSVGPLVIEEKSALHCAISYPCQMLAENVKVEARVRLVFDHSPLIRWQIELDSRGTDLRVELVFETAQQGKIQAGMPFDTVDRPAVDEDLLDRDLDEALEKVLLGQREIGQVRTFPFHDFVAISGDDAGEGSTVAVLAKGLHAYQADSSGTIKLQLRRAVEWLTRPDLETRVGDAGPFFYVPDGRCERTVRHEVAVLFAAQSPHDPDFYAYNAGYQNPPLIVHTGGSGTRTHWDFLAEDLPLSSLQRLDGRILARFYNPTPQALPLKRAYQRTDIAGNPEEWVETIPAKQIVTLAIDPPAVTANQPGSVHLRSGPEWRVGPSQGAPDPTIIQQLQDKVAENQTRLEEIQGELAAAKDKQRYRLQHQAYVIERELLEYRLSLRLNEIKLGNNSPDSLFETDPLVSAIGWQLNQLRIKRRIYDYIVQMI